VAEDWRVTATLHEHGHVAQLLIGIKEHGIESETRHRLGGQVAVSGEGSHVFVYASSEAAAREAERIVRELVGEHGLSAEFAVERWHPLEERWEDASVPFPDDTAAQRAEHERLEEDEAAESQRLGLAEWEVRLELPSHRQAVELAERLEAEGMSVVRRWKYLVVGANNEDEAKEIAGRLEHEAPGEAKIQVEPGPGMLADATRGTRFAATFGF
jgi:hypothetical protein